MKGKSAHGALNPEEGINAVKLAAPIIQELPSGLLDQFSTANLGSIAGGGPVNVVLHRCRIVGELRSRDINAKGLRCFVLGLGMENIHSPRELYRFSRLQEAFTLLEMILSS